MIYLENYQERLIAWSSKTFGAGKRTLGILKHILKEVQEVSKAPDDLEEWIDLMILALDGYWRHGGQTDDLLPALVAKLAKNEARTWPPPTEDEPVEHKRN